MQHLANAMRQLPSHRVGRDELVVELAGHHLKQQSVNLKASNSEAQTRNTRAARRSRRRASLADLVGPQKTIPLSTRRTREYVRFFAAVDIDVDAHDLRRRGQLLDRQHLVAPSPSCCWRHSIAIVLGLGQRRNQRRSPAAGPQSARSPAAQRSARSASPALARVSATRRRRADALRSASIQSRCARASCLWRVGRESGGSGRRGAQCYRVPLRTTMRGTT